MSKKDDLNEKDISNWLDKNPDFLEHYLLSRQSDKLNTCSIEPQLFTKSPTRKEFKDFNYYDKIYSLVQTLNQSLDLETTCKKILKTLCLLLDADRCSLFLVSNEDNDEKILVSVVFDAQSTDTQLKFNNGEQVRLAFGVGIAGYVASTGKSLNIQNAYEDHRFNRLVDQKTGYRTKSILCLPIINELGECIAVAEAINKLSDENSEQNIISFTRHDEDLFSKFMPFIVIAIRNSNLYEQSCKEAYTNKILLELASIVFNENTTVDVLIAKIIENALILLDCEYSQVILLTQNEVSTNARVKNNKLIDKIYESTLKNDEKIKSKYKISDELLKKIIEKGEIYQEKLTQIETNLYIPVKNSSNKTLALIIVQRKAFFNKNNIQQAQTFALFCGIGIQNIVLYENVVRAMNMQHVALDVLSYHASSSEQEALSLSKETIPEPTEYQIHRFSFDEQTLDDLATLKACISIFADLDLISKFSIPYKTLCHFFLTVKKNYRPVAYHNWRHGFNVMSTMYTMLTVRIKKSHLGEKHSLILIFL